MSKYYCTLLLFFFFFLSHSQTVQLTIEDEQGISIPICNVLFKEKNSQVIAEYTKIFDGSINYLLKKNTKI
jgi:homoserine dehydrogenase